MCNCACVISFKNWAPSSKNKNKNQTSLRAICHDSKLKDRTKYIKDVKFIK